MDCVRGEEVFFEDGNSDISRVEVFLGIKEDERVVVDWDVVG